MLGSHDNSHHYYYGSLLTVDISICYSNVYNNKQYLPKYTSRYIRLMIKGIFGGV